MNDYNYNHNNNNFNQLDKKVKGSPSFYEVVAKLEGKELEREDDPLWGKVTVSLFKDEIKRINLVFALLQAHGSSYTCERWMNDVISTALQDLEHYMLYIAGIDVRKIDYVLQDENEQ